MSRKKKHAHHKVVAISPEHLEKKARQQLQSGAYKDAINNYKRLLKINQQPDYLDALGEAYWLAAESQAAKGLYKEAVNLWESRAHSCQQHSHLPRYIIWLLAAGAYIKAIRIFNAPPVELNREEQTHLTAMIGAHLLAADQQNIVAMLDADSPLAKDYPIAKAALKAYCQGDENTLASSLKAIGSRSPYRDFRPVLNALLSLDAGPQEIEQRLSRLKPDSPYLALGRMLPLLQQEGALFIESYQKLGPAQQTFVATLQGWDKRQLRLLGDFRKIQLKGGDKALFDFIVANKRFFGEQESAYFCKALLPYLNKATGIFERHFGALSQAEKYRLEALSCEHRKDHYLAERSWRLYIDKLEMASPAEETDVDLKIALVLRHLNKDLPANDPGVLHNLETSLSLDPNDKASYLHLISAYKQSNYKKSYQSWVVAALQEYPEDIEILLEAVAAARTKNAHKKAAGFAKKILAIDPINAKAQNFLRSSHVAHARKQFKVGRLHLVHKELAAAEQWERNGQESGVLSINRALLALEENHKEQAKALLQTGISQSGGNLCAYLRLCTEALCVDVKPSALVSLMPEIKKISPNKTEVMLLVAVLQAYYEEGIGALLIDALAEISPILKKSLKQTLSETQWYNLAECFLTLEAYDLLEYCTRQALKQQDSKPLLVFYEISATLRGQQQHLTYNMHYRLVEAAEEAHDMNDLRTAARIEQIIKQHAGLPFADTGFDDDDNDFEEAENNVIEGIVNMIKSLSPSERKKILKDMPPEVKSLLMDAGVDIDF
ncbi:tetratricopeptide repeat protein [Candidatus Venteria ishoeyi]|uniref:Tetratricopeptide repeat protein n=1 Tax=Candidatus Venteria ishoeyi TaxID=1899563 RepID=A0A1H6F7S3_9GAMM|nr:hypothetical protein [Candidatus Venteria ishoeyi]SEH06170.1 Uncharacterised protein [Candidatus Venteria ishoeyi]